MTMEKPKWNNEVHWEEDKEPEAKQNDSPHTTLNISPENVQIHTETSGDEELESPDSTPEATRDDMAKEKFENLKKKVAVFIPSWIKNPTREAFNDLMLISTDTKREVEAGLEGGKNLLSLPKKGFELASQKIKERKDRKKIEKKEAELEKVNAEIAALLEQQRALSELYDAKREIVSELNDNPDLEKKASVFRSII